jgi:hypothetical protein
MPQSRSKYQFYQEASLSQQLANRMREYTEYAGADPQTSLAIARLNVLAEFGIIDLNDPDIKLAKAMLNEKRKALFATSPHVNEISKMGMQMPKGVSEVDYDADA